MYAEVERNQDCLLKINLQKKFPPILLASGYLYPNEIEKIILPEDENFFIDYCVL